MITKTEHDLGIYILIGLAILVTLLVIVIFVVLYLAAKSMSKKSMDDMLDQENKKKYDEKNKGE